MKGTTIAARALLAIGLVWAAAGCSSTAGNDNDASGPFVINEDVDIEVSPSSIDFGSIGLGVVETRIIEIRHSGTRGRLQLASVTLVDASDDLSIEGPGATELEVGETTTLTVRYEPSDAEHDAGTIRIRTNVPTAGDDPLTVEVPIHTIAQSVELFVAPAVVSFESVAYGTSETRAVTIRNIGTLPASFESFDIVPPDSDFAITTAPATPAASEPGSTLELEVTYTPTGRDVDNATLQIAHDALDGAGRIDLLLEGHEIAGELAADPNPLDFGRRMAGFAVDETVTLSNEGGLELEISELELVSQSAYGHTVTVLPLPDEGVTLAPGGEETYELAVSFTPDQEQPPSMQALASLHVTSSDPDGVTVIPVFGNRLGKGLEVYPPDILYFGFVGVVGKSLREVLLYNAGQEPLTIDHVYIEGKFGIEDAEEWGPSKKDNVPAVMEPGETVLVRVSFQNNGDWPVGATAWGKLLIESDDPYKPEWEVLLNAKASEPAACVAQLIPDELDFGYVAEGTVASLRFQLVNIGSNVCGFESAVVDDCPSADECTVPGSAESTSVVYSLGEVPETAPDNLPPGASVDIEIIFDGPPIPEGQGSLAQYAGLLTARVSSVDMDGETQITPVPDLSYWGTAANLMGHVARGELSVSPQTIDFGLTPIGCRSQTFVVTAINIGPAPLAITDFALEGCPVEVVLEGYPALDEEQPDGSWRKTLESGDSVTFEVYYQPQDETDDSCTLSITHTDEDQPTVIPVTGSGSFDGTATDVFTDSEPQVVDVLFVVDDSGSMNEEQENLAASFQAFINEAANWDSDYQIGVTTTDINFPHGGKLRGWPPFITEQNWEKFINNVMVGVTGSGEEKGLKAAQIALSPQLLAFTEDECEEPLDCSNPLYECIEGVCGGHNQGFLREGAALELIFVSDEEDQSPDSLEDYLNFFQGLKGFHHPELLHIHAIVGPPGGCTSDNGMAWAGHRYINLAKDTGGVFYSICELDFAKGLEGIGEVAFASQQRYFLAQMPAPTSILVSINGIPCPLMSGGGFNWTYDPTSNSVQLEETGLCQAAPGDIVEVTYDLMCWSPAE